jgi:hypothetical protein
VDEINQQRKEEAYQRYLSDLYAEGVSDSIIDARSESFFNNVKLLEEYGYKEEEFTSIYLHGCFLFAIMNSLSSITGWEYDILKLNDYVRENYNVKTDLSNMLFAKIMNDLTYGYFTIELMTHITKGASLDELNAFIDDRDNGYIFNMKVNDKSVKNATPHFVMANGIMKPVNYPGYVSDTTEFKVANPLQNSRRFNGRSYFTPNNTVRIDVFKITPTVKYSLERNIGIYDSFIPPIQR